MIYNISTKYQIVDYGNGNKASLDEMQQRQKAPSETYIRSTHTYKRGFLQIKPERGINQILMHY